MADLRNCGLNRLLDLGVVGHVTDDKAGLTSGHLDQADGPLQGVGRAARDRHQGAFGRDGQGAGSADTTTAAGDER